MEALQRKSFNQRKFVSVSLFLTLAVLVITGVLIQVFENFEEGFAIHFFTALHVLTGLGFAIFAVLHTKMNWKALKSYIKIKGACINREALWAFFVGVLIVVALFLAFQGHLFSGGI